MKITVKKGKNTNNCDIGTAGFNEKIFIDGQELRNVTDYKISRQATGLGFEVTINMKADVEIIGNDVGSITVPIELDSKEIADIVIEKLNNRNVNTKSKLTI